jgi:hypothetical protein
MKADIEWEDEQWIGPSRFAGRKREVVLEPLPEVMRLLVATAYQV